MHSPFYGLVTLQAMSQPSSTHEDHEIVEQDLADLPPTSSISRTDISTAKAILPDDIILDNVLTELDIEDIIRFRQVHGTLPL